MMNLILVLAYLVCKGILYSQPVIQWQNSFGGPNYDHAWTLTENPTGGYIIAGSSWVNGGNVTGNHGLSDFWVVRLEETGSLLWTKSLGGTQNEDANSVLANEDGSFVIAGRSMSGDGDASMNHGLNDMWVVKINSSSDITWQKSYGGSMDDYAEKIIRTFDGGYLISGHTSSIDGDVNFNHGGFDYWLVKIDSSGNMQWEKTYGGSWLDFCYSVAVTADSGYIAAGRSISDDGDITNHHSLYDYWIVKTDRDGKLQWEKSLGGSSQDYAYSVLQLSSEKNYVVAGYSASNDGDVTGNHGFADYWVVKLDTNANLLWQKSFGGTGVDECYSSHETFDGSVVVTGKAKSKNGDVYGNHGDNDYWVLKVSTTGLLMWQICLGGTDSDGAEEVRETSDGGYIVAGISPSTDGDVTGNHGQGDFWVVKLSSGIVGSETLGQPSPDALIFYPNPFSQSAIISFPRSDKKMKVIIYDLQGRAVGEIIQDVKNSSDTFYRGNLPAGIYFYKSEPENWSVLVGKIIIQ